MNKFKNSTLKIHIIFGISLLLLFGIMATLHKSGERIKGQNPQVLSIQKEKVEKNKKTTVLVLAVVIFSVLLFLYILLLKSVKKTKLLLDSRQLFLRTIIHELKTPIAKGRIIAELIENEEQKKDSIQNYQQLDKIINEFINVEKILSDNYTICSEAIFIDEVIDGACELLHLKNIEQYVFISQQYEQKVDADFNLLAIAIKNLIQNGIKYSHDKKVDILIEKNKMVISNAGKKLDFEVQNYFKPFHQNTYNKNHGLGLGLYIVKTILNMHKWTIDYKYHDGKNSFIIEF